MFAITARRAVALAALGGSIGLLVFADRGASSPPADKPAAARAANSQAPAAQAKAPASEKSGEKTDAAAGQNTGTPVERALASRVTLEFDQTPLKDVAETIAVQQKINVRLDKAALKAAGVSLDLPVTINVHDISLRSALRLMLEALDLDYVIAEDADNVLLITSAAAAKERVVVRVYPVADFATPANPLTNEGPSFDGLIEAVTRTIAPTSWDSAGGAGSIPAFGGNLVISQTLEAHEQIAYLLDQLEAVRKQQQAAPGKVLLPIVDLTSPQAKISHALEARVDLDFDNVPLKDVADYIATKQKIQIQLDSKALTDAGVSVDAPVTFSAKQMRLSWALKEMLGQLELSSYIDHEVLLVTSDAKAKEHLQTVVYPVADLVHDAADVVGSDLDDDYDSLIEAITSTVAPTSWDSAGGAGGVSPLAVPKVLIISQTQAIHGQIERLFAMLRAAKKPAPAAAQPAEAANKPIVRVYQLSLAVPLVAPAPDGTEAQPPAKAAPPAQAPPPPAPPKKAPTAPPTLNQAAPRALKKPPKGPAQFAGDEDMLLRQYIDIIKKLVEPESWKGPTAYIHAFPGRVIVVRQTPAVHRQIIKLLRALKVLEPAQSKFQPQGTPSIPVVG